MRETHVVSSVESAHRHFPFQIGLYHLAQHNTNPNHVQTFSNPTCAFAPQKKKNFFLPTKVVLRLLWEYQIENLLPDGSNRKVTFTSRSERNISTLISSVSIPSSEARFLKRSDSRPPKLYGLSKMHTLSIPLRPIVSDTNLQSRSVFSQ